MSEYTNTSHFTANKFIDGKPSPFKFNNHCFYCKNICKTEFKYYGRERYDYVFCTCDKAQLEVYYKNEIKKLEEECREKRRILQNKITKDNINLKVKSF